MDTPQAPKDGDSHLYFPPLTASFTGKFRPTARFHSPTGRQPAWLGLVVRRSTGRTLKGLSDRASAGLAWPGGKALGW